MFKTYLELGFKHILDVHAYDHILFVLTLCAVYTSKEWRKVVILIKKQFIELIEVGPL